MTTPMVLRRTIPTFTPHRAAMAFQFALAVDRGYTSELLIKGSSVTVVASDGQAVKFVRANALAEGN